MLPHTKTFCNTGNERASSRNQYTHERAMQTVLLLIYNSLLPVDTIVHPQQ